MLLEAVFLRIKLYSSSPTVINNPQKPRKRKDSMSLSVPRKLSLAKNGKTRETERFKRIDHRQARVLFSGGDAFDKGLDRP